MRPFLRSLDSGVPAGDGWAVEPVGEWNGRDVEVVYDLRRHQVLLARNGSVDELEPDLAAGGWEYHSTDGVTSLWVRDRLQAARARLAQEPPIPSPEPATGLEGPGL